MRDSNEKGKAQFTPREVELHEKWKGVSEQMPVNEQQHSFDTPERQRQFLEAQFTTDEEWQRYRSYREEWFRRPKEFDPGPAPLAVGIELVSSCNLACSMCYTITEEFQGSVVGSQRMLPWEIVKAVVDECAELGVESILFSWRGESTLYKSRHNGRTYRFHDALQYARDKGILEVTSLTNGQLIDEEMAQGIIEAEPNWINFSIDGLGSVYNRIRKPAGKQNPDSDPFDQVVQNIRRLVELRDAAGKTRPQIRTNTIYPCIADDPQGYFQFMDELGVGWVTVNEILDFRGAGTDGEELPEEAIIPDWSCQYPFQRLMVAANGVIVPCTGAHNEEEPLVLGRYKGASEKVVRGKGGEEIRKDFPERTLYEAWHCGKLQGVRRAHQLNKREQINPGCRNCRHGAVKHGVEWIPEDWNMQTMEWVGHKFRNG